MLDEKDKINILIEDYCTLEEAKRFLKQNKVEFYDLEEFKKNINEYLEELMPNAEEEQEEFKNWLKNEKYKQYNSFSKVEYKNNKYLLSYIL